LRQRGLLKTLMSYIVVIVAVPIVINMTSVTVPISIIPSVIALTVNPVIITHIIGSVIAASVGIRSVDVDARRVGV